MTPEECTRVAESLVKAERRKQDRMWGGAPHDDLHDGQEWFTILCRQEVHVAEAINGPRNLTTELTQLLAVGMAWLEAELRRDLGGTTDPHARTEQEAP